MDIWNLLRVAGIFASVILARFLLRHIKPKEANCVIMFSNSIILLSFFLPIIDFNNSFLSVVDLIKKNVTIFIVPVSAYIIAFILSFNKDIQSRKYSFYSFIAGMLLLNTAILSELPNPQIITNLLGPIIYLILPLITLLAYLISLKSYQKNFPKETNKITRNVLFGIFFYIIGWGIFAILRYGIKFT